MSEPTHNYTRQGWEGERYNPNLSTKEIAKLARKCFKTTGYKWSITSDYNSISVHLMAAPYEAFSEEIDRGYTQVNHYYLDRDTSLTMKAKEDLQKALHFLQSFNFDDSDSMIDYFHTNFYLSFSVGRWDRSFVNTAQ